MRVVGADDAEAAEDPPAGTARRVTRPTRSACQAAEKLPPLRARAVVTVTQPPAGSTRCTSTVAPSPARSRWPETSWRRPYRAPRPARSEPVGTPAVPGAVAPVLVAGEGEVEVPPSGAAVPPWAQAPAGTAKAALSQSAATSVAFAVRVVM